MINVCVKCHGVFAVAEEDRGLPILIQLSCPGCRAPALRAWQARVARLERRMRVDRLAVLAHALDRARKVGLPATLTMDEFDAMSNRFRHRCAYCGRPAHLIEHATPISRGGGTTAANCLPACLQCNVSKGTKTIEEFVGDDHLDALAHLWACGRPRDAWITREQRRARVQETMRQIREETQP